MNSPKARIGEYHRRRTCTHLAPTARAAWTVRLQRCKPGRVLIEVLPPVLVLHLKRFLYDVAADSLVKISKPVQFAPELEIPLGTIFSFASPVLAKAKNNLGICRSRNDGTCCWEICGAGALQASRGTLSPWRVRQQRELYGRCAPPEWRQW